jgi:hypothetical protein
MKSITENLLLWKRCARIKWAMRRGNVLIGNRRLDPTLARNQVSAYLNFFKYQSPIEFRPYISKEILSLYDEGPTPTLYEIRLVCEQEIMELAGYLLTNFSYDKTIVGRMLKSKSEQVRNFGVAIAINEDYLDAIPGSDYDSLFLYFIERRIVKTNATTFSTDGFLKILTARLVQEDGSVLDQTRENIATLIESGAIQVALNVEFFKKLFERRGTLTESDYKMFRIAILKFPGLFSVLTDVRLRIDPFTFQVDYSSWITHAQKLMFLNRLRVECAFNADNPGVAEFDGRINSFRDVFKGEQILP